MTTDFYEIWKRYNRSKTYVSSKGLIRKAEKNWLMYSGKQWEAVEDSQGMENLPMLNFIKPTVKYKVSSIASSSITALFSDLNSTKAVESEEESAVSRLNKLFSISWEKGKMGKNAKRCLKYSAVEGDAYCVWLEGGDTRTEPQIIHSTSMRFGDENITSIQDQPWIIIEERLTLDVVREKARRNGCTEDEIRSIVTDSDLENAIVNKNEVDNKVTSLLYMEKDRKTGIVSVGRATQTVMYEKLRPIQQSRDGKYTDVGLKMYPICSMVWEEMPNNARGMGEVEQLIPNQLEANKTLARRAMSVKMTAYPKLAYDESSIANPEDLDKVGSSIKINGGNAQVIGNMISYLAPQAMSMDAKQLSDELISMTRSLAGASDAQLGNIDLSRVSGTAAQTIRDQQQLPLNEQQEMYQDFIENVALLWFELWKVYHPEGVEMDGVKVSAEEIADIQPNVRVDIAEDTTLSKLASQQELTNMFNNGKITFEEFAEAYPEHSSVSKEVLMNIVRTRKEQMERGEMPTNENGQSLDPTITGDSVNVGGASGGSYQSVQSMLAR